MKYKKFTLILLAAILYLNTFSQLRIKNQKVLGGSLDDNFTCLALTKDGGSIVGGDSPSGISGTKTEINRGENDYWIVKLDSTQKVQWDKTFGGKDREYLAAIQQTDDGGYILGGSSLSRISGDKTQDKIGNYDYWVIKLDSLGNKQWDKTIGGSDKDILESIGQTKAGGYILGGWSSSPISGNKTEACRGGVDYWIVRLDKSGNIKWDKTMGGNKTDALYSLQQTDDGGFILGGSSTSDISGDKTEDSHGTDCWVIKLDSLHNIQWQKTIGGKDGDAINCIQQTQDGGYILGALSNSNISGDKTRNSRGYNDYWLIKLNNEGEIQWDKTIGGNDFDVLYSLQQTIDGGYILGGISRSSKSGEKSENNRGGYDYWIVKLNSNHKIEWDATIGGTGDENFVNIKETNKNHYLLSGTSNSPVSGDKRKPLIGGNDYWVVYLDYNDTSKLIAASNQTSFQNATAINKNFSTYPNPVKDILYVQSKSKTNFSLTDQSGKTILTKTIEGNGEINVADLTPGIYYLKNNETGITQKILVIK